MWLYQEQEQTEVPEGYIGFIYEISNNITGRKYIGRKLYHFTKTKVLKGKKNRVKTESDWLSYFGCCDELTADVEALGTNQFKRTILHQCKTLGVLNYREAKEQMVREVLESDDYYNSAIMVRSHRNHLKAL